MLFKFELLLARTLESNILVVRYIICYIHINFQYVGLLKTNTIIDIKKISIKGFSLNKLINRWMQKKTLTKTNLKNAEIMMW